MSEKKGKKYVLGMIGCHCLFFFIHSSAFFHPFICIFHFIYLPISQKNSTFASAFIYKVGNDFTITTKA